MTPRQQLFALVASLGLLLFIVEMVRRRRLREEYSWLWILTGVVILLLSAWFGLLEWLTHLVGAVVPVSTLFVLGILFLVVINIYFSMKISTLTTQVKNLAQRLAIVDHYVQESRAAGESRGSPDSRRTRDQQDGAGDNGNAGPAAGAGGAAPAAGQTPDAARQECA